MSSRTFLLAGIAAAAFGASSATFAQTAPATPTPEARAATTVIVTARKVAESVQDIPISVTAFSNETLQSRQIESITDIASFTPGLQFNEAFGRGSGERPVIRGASNILVSDGKVGVFIDGIPLIGRFGTIDLSNMERVEVIKGPQSAVYGRGTLTGAINYVMKKPTDKTEVQVEATVGNYGQMEMYGYVGGKVPFIEGVRASLALRGYTFDGDRRNEAPYGGKLNGQSSNSVNFALFFDPSPDFSLTARYMFNEDNDEHYAIALQPSTANNCFLDTRAMYCGKVQTPKRYALNLETIPFPGTYRQTQRGLVDARWDIMGSGYELSYQFGTTGQMERTGIDQTYNAQPWFFYSAFVCTIAGVPNSTCAQSPFEGFSQANRNANTHEVRLSSPRRDKLRWQVGYFNIFDKTIPQVQAIESTQSGLDALGSITKIKSYAVFGSLQYDITNNLKVGLELRHQNDEVTDQGQQYQARQYFQPGFFSTVRFPNPNQIVGSLATRTATFKKTLPRFTVDYRVNPDLLVYAQYAEGNSPGGFNDTTAPVATYREENLKNYEAGVKTSLFGFNTLNVTGFYQEYTDQVLTQTFERRDAAGNVVNLDSYRSNLGNTETKGIEVEAMRTLFEGFTVNGTYSYVDAKIVSGVDNNQAVILLGEKCRLGSPLTPASQYLATCGAAQSIVGKTPPLVSKHLASLSFRYLHALGIADFDYELGADVIYRSSFFGQVDNLNFTGAATKVNLQASIKNDRMRVTLWGKNVGNEDTAEGILRYIDDPQTVRPSIAVAPNLNRSTPRAFGITPPRRPTYGITVGYKW